MNSLDTPASNSNPKYLIPEEVYDYEHPEIVYWTKYFMEEANKRNVFTNIQASIDAKRSLIASESMASSWYEFTLYVPIFITKAVTLTDDPERQHHLIQIAYDELGGRDKEIIHSKLYVEALKEIGIDISKVQSNWSINDVLAGLDSTLVNTSSQYGIVGLLMSFEIIAEENIEMLFNCLCYDETCDEKMSQTPFFQIHRQDESEHIRHSVANFLRFCKTEQQRDEFKKSFNEGIDFWERFWDQCARAINLDCDSKKIA